MGDLWDTLAELIPQGEERKRLRIKWIKAHRTAEQLHAVGG